MKLNNTNFRDNKMKDLKLTKTHSHICIDSVTFTNNHDSKAFFYHFWRKKIGNV